MKKIFIVLLMCVMLAALAACTENTAEISGGETSDSGLLVMATNAAFPPYEFYDGTKVIGIDAEIAALIAKELGRELEIMDIEFDSIIAAVQAGKADMGMAGMTVTEDRLKSVNFSTSYALGVQVVIVKEDGPIQSKEDLEDPGGFVIGVQASTTGDLYATWDIEDEDLGKVDRYNKGADAVLALVTGKVDCVIIDNEPAKAFVAGNTGLKILDTEYANEDYAICIAKDNTDLLDQVNAALNKLINDGSVQTIIDKYITAK